MAVTHQIRLISLFVSTFAEVGGLPYNQVYYYTVVIHYPAGNGLGSTPENPIYYRYPEWAEYGIWSQFTLGSGQYPIAPPPTSYP